MYEPERSIYTIYIHTIQIYILYMCTKFKVYTKYIYTIQIKGNSNYYVYMHMSVIPVQELCMYVTSLSLYIDVST